MTFRELHNRRPSRDDLDTRSGARVIADKLREYKWTPKAKERTGVRRLKRRAKPRRDNFLSLIRSTPMRDWKPGHGLANRNKRKAARQKARRS